MAVVPSAELHAKLAQGARVCGVKIFVDFPIELVQRDGARERERDK